jgi:hypothetical protein
MPCLLFVFDPSLLRVRERKNQPKKSTSVYSSTKLNPYRSTHFCYYLFLFVLYCSCYVLGKPSFESDVKHRDNIKKIPRTEVIAES